MLQSNGSASPTVASQIVKAETYGFEGKSEKRAETLQHLLKANHDQYSLIHSRTHFINHTTHILSSGYILGAKDDALEHFYETESRFSEPWHDSPRKISKQDWRSFLGKPEFQLAFKDFFQSQLDGHYNGDWRALLEDYMFSGNERLINSLIGAISHPLIHLGYAYEMSSGTIAIEALVLAACFYNRRWQEYLDEPKSAPSSGPSLLTILKQVGEDSRFDKLRSGGHLNIEKILSDKDMKTAALEHWKSWDLKCDEQFVEAQKLAVALLVATAKGSTYDFFFTHAFTSSHAVRVLLSSLPDQYHTSLIRQWWLFTLLIYISELRPKINLELMDIELGDRDWNYVLEKALKGKHSTDAHYMKPLRSMHVAAKTWGDEDEFFLKAATKMADGFGGWKF